MPNFFRSDKLSSNTQELTEISQTAFAKSMVKNSGDSNGFYFESFWRSVYYKILDQNIQLDLARSSLSSGTVLNSNQLFTNSPQYSFFNTQSPQQSLLESPSFNPMSPHQTLASSPNFNPISPLNFNPCPTPNDYLELSPKDLPTENISQNSQFQLSDRYFTEHEPEHLSQESPNSSFRAINLQFETNSLDKIYKV
jgi:hypothetical protein